MKRFVTAVMALLILGSTAASADPDPAKSGGTLRLAVRTLQDPTAKCDAVRLLLPHGWRAAGRFDWSSNPADPCRITLSMYHPDGAEAVNLCPSLLFADGAREEMARMLSQGRMSPDQARQQAARTYPEGASYYGLEVRSLIADPRRLAEQILLPRSRPEVKNPKIVALDESPRLADEAFARDEADARASGFKSPGNARYTGRRLRLEYTANGKRIEEEIYYVTYVIPISGLSRHWGIRGPISFRAEKGRLDRAMPVLRTIQTSVKPIPAWLAFVKQVSNSIHQASQRQLKITVDQALRSAERSGQIFDQLHRQYREREAMYDRVQEKFIQSIRGAESYSDPMQELPIELPTGYERAWINERGEYVLSEKTFNEPHVGSSDHWRELRKLKPGQK